LTPAFSLWTLFPLTDTPKHILLDILCCAQAKEIVPQLGVSFWTIEERVANIYKKLHVRSRAEAVAKYLGT
jgi:DNA-binding NarL/FixJ family response regulator